MRIRKPDQRVPKPAKEALAALIREIAPPGTEVAQWMIDLAVVAYQNGRYDESSAETFSAAFE